MKKIKLIILYSVFYFSSTKAHTSVYHPLPDSNASWNFQYVDIMSASTAFYSIIITGDTLINGLTYHKLFTPFVNSSFPGLLANFVGYRGAFRQDTSIKMVFFVPPADSIEQILYDFNWQFGNTVLGYLNYYHLNEYVQSIDSILVGGSYRKRWGIGICPVGFLIEGIGSTMGLLEILPLCGSEASVDLTCFTQNGVTIYPDTLTHCQLIDGIENISSKNNFMSIYPNPFHSTSLLQFGDKFNNAELRIFSVQGLLIRKEKLSQQSKYILERINLCPGIYFVQLINELGDGITKKIIVE